MIIKNLRYRQIYIVFFQKFEIKNRIQTYP